MQTWPKCNVNNLGEKKESCPHHSSFHPDRIDLIKIKSNFAPDLKVSKSPKWFPKPSWNFYFSLDRREQNGQCYKFGIKLSMFTSTNHFVFTLFPLLWL